ncbi:T9SS type A sorting domain-containing protein [Hymenobacter metallicola]|uniref:T9SS type A sorting domain-containing protein n=1 Tax=Hymenobacter metallicola TaxID=2563114 RepID=A0A4Z0Q1D1_9BACT|nr:T9SS type A sorting domain-containing protein [Hymenobacter metallicola]TGE23495.1 T9SS type A sorting domain-containing protein [Hymenobacter metallicola]
MKKLLLLGFTSLLSLAASAQITLEKKHSSSLDFYKLSTGEVKYAGFSEATNQVNIYNQNHSLYRQIPVNVPTGYALDGVDYISDKLFNTTAGLEVLVCFFSRTPAAANFVRILDETGSTVATLDSSTFVRIANTPTGTKLISSITEGAPSYSKVYALGGIYTPLKAAGKSDELTASPYPNPAAESIRLPYLVKKGEVATLDVLNLTGQVVKSYQVDSTFDHLQLSARELPAGTYVYRVTSASGTTAGKKSIVGR